MTRSLVQEPLLNEFGRLFPWMGNCPTDQARYQGLRGNSEWSPEQRMAAAMVLSAAEDLLLTHRHPGDRASAWAFIFAADHDGVSYSFASLCFHLGLNVDYLRRELKRMSLETHEKPSKLRRWNALTPGTWQARRKHRAA